MGDASPLKYVSHCLTEPEHITLLHVYVQSWTKYLAKGKEIQ